MEAENAGGAETAEDSAVAHMVEKTPLLHAAVAACYNGGRDGGCFRFYHHLLHFDEFRNSNKNWNLQEKCQLGFLRATM